MDIKQREAVTHQKISYFCKSSIHKWYNRPRTNFAKKSYLRKCGNCKIYCSRIEVLQNCSAFFVSVSILRENLRELTGKKHWILQPPFKRLSTKYFSFCHSNVKKLVMVVQLFSWFPLSSRRWCEGSSRKSSRSHQHRRVLVVHCSQNIQILSPKIWGPFYAKWWKYDSISRWK